MCGFLAEYQLGNYELSAKADFLELLQLSYHRGPDDLGYFKSDNYQLGFNRLAILDITSKGSQPMLSPSGRYHLVFNGEIYNYKELTRSHHLKNLNSSSDTEVITHLLDSIGFKATVQALNGMFAIAVIDTIDQTLFMARDFAGIKPLFYGISAKGIVAASQFNQIFKHPFFKDDLKLKKEVVKDYFGMGYMQAPNTVFENIHQLQPGTYMKVSKNGTIRTHTYHQFDFDDHNKANYDIKNLKLTLDKAIKLQLASDVPLATFLSGGIDSPVITAIAKKNKSDLTAFTMSVKDSILDESESATAFALKLGINHEVHTINQVELLNAIDTHFSFLSEPFGDYSSIPTYFITKVASQRFTVMLSGDGGDELFFGYPRMLDVIKKRHWFKVPYKLRKPLIRVLNKIGNIHTWAPYHYKTLEEWIQSKHCFIEMNRLHKMFPETRFSDTVRSLYKLPPNLNRKKLLSWLRDNEFNAHLQRILIKVDRMSMANSMEVRVPFLDKNVIVEALQYMPSRFEDSSDLKQPLKSILKEFNEGHVRNNQKKGFSVPINDWLLNDLKEDLETIVLNTPLFGASHFNSKEITNYVSEFLEGKHENGWGIWHIYAWQKWALKNNLADT